jgi:hypothetical protein
VTEVNGHDALDTSLRESVGGRAASWIAASASRAWTFSAVRASVAPIATDWSLLSRAQRIRAVALTVAVAMLTERSMRWLLRRPTDPLSAVLPLGVLAASVAVAVSASALARLSERPDR